MALSADAREPAPHCWQLRRALRSLLHLVRYARGGDQRSACFEGPEQRAIYLRFLRLRSALRKGDIVNPLMRPAGILVPTEAGRGRLVAGFGQIESQVMKIGMIAEVTCIAKPMTIIPMVVVQVQDERFMSSHPGWPGELSPSRRRKAPLPSTELLPGALRGASGPLRARSPLA